MSALGNVLRTIKAEHNIGLGDLTVLSPQNDPFRLDTPANHEVGCWLRDQMADAGLLSSQATIHNRGIHYALVSRDGVKLPSGLPYENNAECWAFLEDRASKAARWLGYVAFDKIIDARNAEPIIREHEHSVPSARIRVEADFYLPAAEDLEPRIEVVGFQPRQRYRLVFFGEKTSLEGVLGPLATDFQADLYLPSGELSDTQIHRMARTGASDGREMVVLVFADSDPAGYQMAVSIGHKLRAFRECLYPSLKFRLLAPALTVEHVKDLGLPSTPLKETELRAAGWRERYGVEQTEIDALATLRPEILRRIAREAVAPFFDSSLSRRATNAEETWRRKAQARFEEQVNPAWLVDIRTRAEADLEALRDKLHEIEVGVADLDIDLPPFEIPEAEMNGADVSPLVSSDMPLVEAIRILQARKRYGNTGEVHAT
jgi:hypothetical protein